MLKKLYGPCGVQLPQGYRAIMLRRQFTFSNYVPGIPQNDERLNLEPPSGFEHRKPTTIIEE